MAPLFARPPEELQPLITGPFLQPPAPSLVTSAALEKGAFGHSSETRAQLLRRTCPTTAAAAPSGSVPPAGQTAAAPLATSTRKHAPDISFPAGAHNTAELDCWASSNYANVFEGSRRRNGQSRRGLRMRRRREDRSWDERTRQSRKGKAREARTEQTSPADSRRRPPSRPCARVPTSRTGLFARRGAF